MLHLELETQVEVQTFHLIFHFLDCSTQTSITSVRNKIF